LYSSLWFYQVISFYTIQATNAKKIREKYKLGRICSSHFRGWQFYVEALLDYNVVTVQCTMNIVHELGSNCHVPTDSLSPPPPPNTLPPHFFHLPSPDYSQLHCDNFGDFLERLANALASTFLYASTFLLFANSIRLTQFHIYSINVLHDATDFSSANIFIVEVFRHAHCRHNSLVFGTNFRYLETLIFSSGPLI
jgi:hypothetical protein